MPFFASLFLPSFSCGYGKDGLIGFGVLMYGWMGLMALDPRWFANPMFFCIVGSAVLFEEPGPTGKIFAIIAPLLALSAVFVGSYGVCGDTGSMQFSGPLASGGYLWVGAVVMSAVAYYSYAPERTDS